MVGPHGVKAVPAGAKTIQSTIYLRTFFKEWDKIIFDCSLSLISTTLLYEKKVLEALEVEKLRAQFDFKASCLLQYEDLKTKMLMKM